MFSARIALITLLVCLLGLPAFAQQSYTIVDLGTLGGTYSSPTYINLFSDVSGISYIAGDEYNHAFFSHRGTMTDLITFGGDNSWTGALNNLSQVVGGAETTLQEAADYTFFRADALPRGTVDAQSSSPRLRYAAGWN